MLATSPVVQTGPYPQMGARVGSKDQDVRPHADILYQEKKWRRLDCDVASAGEEIAVSRWMDPQNAGRTDEATTPLDRYVIGVAMRSTRLRLVAGSQVIFDGIMPAGTLHLSCPSRQLSAQFVGPFDFLHLHVAVDYFRRQRAITQLNSAEELTDFILLRDSFAEQLGRAVIQHGTILDRSFARCIAETLAIRTARLDPPQTKVNALPKWRLRRVEEYITERLDRNVSLPELAKVAGLSRMHFAAQFRGATGYRPREYLLHRRVEQAKLMLSSSNMPLVEVALAVGFSTQAHFSTVFKRVTGNTPARWRTTGKAAPPTA